MLSNALHQVLQCVAPSAVDVVTGSQSLFPENIYLEKPLQGIESLASSMGIPVGAADHSLIESLKHIAYTDPDDKALVNGRPLLPYALASAFTAPCWCDKSIGYLVAKGSLSNNGQLLMYAVDRLLAVFKYLRMPDVVVVSETTKVRFPLCRNRCSFS